MTDIPVPRRPPPLVPKPGMVKVVRALYAYTAQQHDELTFEEGDTLYLLDMTDKNWWKARRGTSTGLIPSNYVEQNTESIDYPLHEAAKRGNLTFLTECLNNRVSVNGLDKAGSTPVHWAAHGGHIECLAAILAVHNSQVNVQNKLGDTPLHSGAWKGHADVVEQLIEKGADPHLRNNDGKTASDLAKNPEVAALLQQAVSPKAYTDEYGDEEDSD